MKPLPESKYWIEAPSASVTDEPDSAVLVLRLALAVNALRSEQGHTLLIGDDPKSAAGKRDRVLSFVIAAAFIREALNILTGTGEVKGESKAVLALAKETEVPDSLVSTVSQLMAGTHPAPRLLVRIRNQLTFHWDPEVVRESLTGFEKDEPLIWSEGETTTVGGSIYRLAADVLANASQANCAVTIANDVAPPARGRHRGDYSRSAPLRLTTGGLLKPTDRHPDACPRLF